MDGWRSEEIGGCPQLRPCRQECLSPWSHGPPRAVMPAKEGVSIRHPGRATQGVARAGIQKSLIGLDSGSRCAALRSSGMTGLAIPTQPRSLSPRRPGAGIPQPHVFSPGAKAVPPFQPMYGLDEGPRRTLRAAILHPTEPICARVHFRNRSRGDRRLSHPRKYEVFFDG